MAGDMTNELRRLLAFLSNSVPAHLLPKSEAIFVFGHTDPRVAEHAADLYHNSKARLVLVSGGKGERTVLPDGFETEAQYFASILKTRGVSPSDVVLECRATNTLENVKFGMKELQTHYGYEPGSVIAVGMPPLLRRSVATFKKHYPETSVLGSAMVPKNPNEWFEPRWIRRLIGEVDRLRSYAAKGDIAEVEIPSGITSIVEVLRTQYVG